MKKTLNPLENARRTAGISGGGGGGGISNATLSLNHNTDNDPIINLEYEEAGATLSSPVAFDKADFYVSNNHMKVEGLDVLKTDVDELSDEYNELDTKVSELTDQLTTFHYRNLDGQRQISDDGVNWENFSKSPFAEFDKYDGLYTQSGLSVYSGRCSIKDGGYYVKDGICYVKITVNNILSSISNHTLVKGFPIMKNVVFNKDYFGMTTQNNNFDCVPLAMQLTRTTEFDLCGIHTNSTEYAYNSDDYTFYFKYEIA